ncbi:MAG: response regulator [Arenimonas sp.]|nr:response regulator [Arenimonas sp.]
MSTLAFLPLDLQHPHLVIVDGSKLVRRVLTGMLAKTLPNAVITECESAEQVKSLLLTQPVHLLITSLVLPDMDGSDLAAFAREKSTQSYFPIIVVSAEVQERLAQRTISPHVTDYFDKTWGMEALASFIKGYIAPEEEVGGQVLYVEDSRVVAAATIRMMKKHGLGVQHAVSVEDALVMLDQPNETPPDIILSDVYLKGELTGMDLLKILRQDREVSKKQLPIVVMTGDSDPRNQKQLIQLGANDLVQKPIEERLLITKLLFQLRMARKGQMPAA